MSGDLAELLESSTLIRITNMCNARTSSVMVSIVAVFVATVTPICAGAASAISQPSGSLIGWCKSSDLPDPNTGFVAVASNCYNHVLALNADGSIFGCGPYGSIAPPDPNADFIAVVTGYQHHLALKSDGSIVAWGEGCCGEEVAPELNTGFVAIAAAGSNNGSCCEPYGHSLALKSDGSIVAWGYNAYGQTDVPEPNEGFIAIAATPNRSYGVKSDGKIVIWGSDYCGWAGGYLAPPEPNSDFIAVAPAVYSGCHVLGLKSDGSIVAWGEFNQYGQLDVPEPNSGFIEIGAADFVSWGLKADGSIVAWGESTFVPEPNSGFIAISGTCAAIRAVEPPAPGDLTCDGVVDGADLLILLSAWGKCGDPDECIADLNDDSGVDGADLLILLANWG
jgi:hypothetical protein